MMAEEPKKNPALEEFKRQTNLNAIFYEKLLKKFDEYIDEFKSMVWVLRLIVVVLILLILSQCVKIG